MSDVDVNRDWLDIVGWKQYEEGLRAGFEEANNQTSKDAQIVRNEFRLEVIKAFREVLPAYKSTGGHPCSLIAAARKTGFNNALSKIHKILDELGEGESFIPQLNPIGPPACKHVWFIREQSPYHITLQCEKPGCNVCWNMG